MVDTEYLSFCFLSEMMLLKSAAQSLVKTVINVHIPDLCSAFTCLIIFPFLIYPMRKVLDWPHHQMYFF